MQKEGLNGFESASLGRVTGLVSKSESELSLDMETLFSISDAFHVVSMFLYPPMSSQMLEQTLKVLDEFTWAELRITKRRRRRKSKKVK